MGSIDKLRVLLQHWIEHNSGHVAEFSKWQKTMTDDKRHEVAAALEEAIQRMDGVSETLQKTLDVIGGPVAGAGCHHHHR